MRKLFSNVLHLSFIQYSAYLLPVVLYPFLLNTIGENRLGSVIFGQTIAALLGLIVGYGFDLSGIHSVSRNLSNFGRLGELFSAITAIRALLFVIIAIPFFTIVIISNFLRPDFSLFCLCYLTLIELVVFPRWFFIGIQEMKYLSIIFSLSKIVATLLILALVKGPEDFLLIPSSYLVTTLLCAPLIYVILVRKIGINISFPTRKNIALQLTQGWTLFVASLTVGILVNVNVLLLGFFAPREAVAQYGIVEKLIRVAQNLLRPISEALFPSLSKDLATKTREDGLLILIKVFKPYFLLLIFVAIAVFCAGNFILGFLFDVENKEVKVLFAIMILAVFFGPANFLLGNIGLCNLGETKYFSRTVVLVALISVILSYLLVYNYGSRGAATVFTLAEVLLFSLLAKRFSQLGHQI